jgi:hypothetical protein
MGVRDNTVEVELGVGETYCRGSDILIGIEEIAANSHANAPGLGFARAHGTNKLSVSNLASLWDLMWVYEKHRVVAASGFSSKVVFLEALSAATPFVGE